MVSIPRAAAISFPREEALLVAGLLALTGGYLDAYTWIAFGMGAAIGAVMTKVTRAYSLAVPVALLVIVLLLCEQSLRSNGRRAFGDLI